MKTLSLRQPWLWAVLHAGKRIENRCWKRDYRGPILLHAAKGCTHGEMIQALDWMMGNGMIKYEDWPGLDNVDRGGICGRARIVDVIPPLPPGPSLLAEELHYSQLPEGANPRWHMPEQFGFVLVDVEPLPFVAWPGALGLFEVPEDYATRPKPTGRMAWGGGGYV